MLGIEDPKRMIEKYFRVYAVRGDKEVISFYCEVDITTLEERFNALNTELGAIGYIPMIVFEGGEYIIHVSKKLPIKYRSVNVNIVLLIITFLTTLFAGALMWVSYEPIEIALNTLPRILFASFLFFSFPLMTILGLHEFGHYYIAKRHGVAASLPFFLPAPPPLGTFGAFITMREPIPNKKALFDIGIAGPIFGFLIAVPITAIGLFLTNYYSYHVPSDSSNVMFLGIPLIFQGLLILIPSEPDVLLHPTAMAGWVGLLVTALNLLPAGQLDGGHIARACFGIYSKYAGYISVFALISIGVYFGYFGWILFIIIIILIGLYHPPPLNDLTGLDNKRKFLGFFAAIILVISFTAVPISEAPLYYGIHMEIEDSEGNIYYNKSVQYIFTVYNTGNTKEEIKLTLEGDDLEGIIANLSTNKIDVPVDKPKKVMLNVTATSNLTVGKKFIINITGSCVQDKKKKATITTLTTYGFFEILQNETEKKIERGKRAKFNITAVNMWNRSMEFNFTLIANLKWDYSLSLPSLFLGLDEKVNFTLTVFVPSNARSGERFVLSINSTWREDQEVYQLINFTVIATQRYELEFKTEKIKVERGKEAKGNIKITNYGGGVDFVGLKLTSKELKIEPSKQLLTLKEFESTNLELTISASEELEKGNYYIDIFAYSNSYADTVLEIEKSYQERIEVEVY
ncbi:MAG: site-2 protease family protein [Candidatus Thermoplasmatota archaeon]